MARSTWRGIRWIALAALASCGEPRPANYAEPKKDAAESIVALPNGATMVAAPGTVARDLVDWLATDERQRLFELGGQEYDGRSTEPTMESKLRLRRFVQMLKAHPDVEVRVIGHTDKTADEAADMQLSLARAERIVRLLKDARIPATRLSAEGRGGDVPVASDATDEGRARNQRVTLLLTRKS